MLSQSVISVPAVWKLAEQIGKIQTPNKSQKKSANSAANLSGGGGGGLGWGHLREGTVPAQLRCVGAGPSDAGNFNAPQPSTTAAPFGTRTQAPDLLTECCGALNGMRHTTGHLYGRPAAGPGQHHCAHASTDPVPMDRQGIRSGWFPVPVSIVGRSRQAGGALDRERGTNRGLGGLGGWRLAAVAKNGSEAVTAGYLTIRPSDGTHDRDIVDVVVRNGGYGSNCAHASTDPMPMDRAHPKCGQKVGVPVPRHKSAASRPSNAEVTPGT